MASIFVIEDEAHIQRLIKLVLEKNGHEVSAAVTGQAGLDHLLSGDGKVPDLILLDILMPGLDGLQVLAGIKSSSRTRDIPVCMLSALAQENIILQGIKLGATDYIRKPFHPSELVERVSKLI